jgi:hypothetical protein
LALAVRARVGVARQPRQRPPGSQHLARRYRPVTDATDRPPSVEEIVDALHTAEHALGVLLAADITAPRALAELVGNGQLVASCAEARHDVRVVIARIDADQ